MRKLFLLGLFAVGAWAQTAINDTLYLQDSAPWTGVITVSWPAFSNCSGTAIGAGSRDYAVTNGVVSITLYPTDCASPSFSYGARYRTSVGTNRGVSWSETWAIPSTPSIVTIRAVRQSSTFTIQPGQIMSGGATSGQCLAWSGTAWVPAACGTGGGAVSSVAGRTGDVVLAQSDITGLVAALAGKAASNATTTVNGQSCALGSTCTVTDSTKAPATSGTAPLKGNGAGGTTAATASDIAGLFSGCSGTQYLGADGACHASGGGGGTWGSITGTLSSQSDLNTALAGKQSTLSNYSTISGLTGYPSTFAPSAHASIHASGGGDAVTLAESQVTGLVSDLAGKAASGASTTVNGTSCSLGSSCTVTAAPNAAINLAASGAGGVTGTLPAANIVANVRARSFGYSFSNSGTSLTTPMVGYFTVPYSCTISAWNIAVDTGTATIDVLKIASGTGVPTSSITGSATPAISTGNALHSTTLTGWTTSVAANDIIGIKLTSVAAATFANLTLECDQ